MLRVGTVGTSSIMRTIQEAIRLTDGMECRVVYSRTEERAKEFAAAQGAKAEYEKQTERERPICIFVILSRTEPCNANRLTCRSAS